MVVTLWMANQMPANPIRTKLEGLLAYTMSARRLRRQPFYVGYRSYSYLRDLAAGLVGVGLTFPLLPFIARSEQNTELMTAVSGLAVPPPVKVVTILAGVTWVVLRVVVGHEQWEKRATLARSCIHRFKQLEARLLRSLESRDPMPELLEIQREMNALVDRSIQEEAWPWAGIAPTVDQAAVKRADELSQRFGGDWQKYSARERR